MRTRRRERSSRQGTPIQAAARGAAAGLVATLALSVLSRTVPGLWNRRTPGPDAPAPRPPDNPDDPEQVREWQDRSRSPAAFQPPGGGAPVERRGGSLGITPTGALTQPQGPGPEGLAEQFAFKVAAGVFNRDISSLERPVGMATHLAYGSLWGVLFGILRASYRENRGFSGPLYGLLVYAVGPALLVPAMHLMQSPRKEPPERTAMLLLGHLVYGVTLAGVFDGLKPEGD